jgi:hypothetical protein
VLLVLLFLLFILYYRRLDVSVGTVRRLLLLQPSRHR